MIHGRHSGRIYVKAKHLTIEEDATIFGELEASVNKLVRRGKVNGQILGNYKALEKA